MPRLTRTIPSYRKHRPSGQAVVTLSGRDFYLGPHGTQVSRREYDRLISEWLQQGRQFRPKSHDGATLAVVQLIVAYLNFAREYYRKDGVPTSESKAIVCSLRYVKLLYGRKPVDEFGPIALQAVMRKMVDDGISRGVVNQNAGRIKRMFRWGVAQELIPASIHHALSSVKGLQKGRSIARETQPVLPVEDTVVDATIEWLPEVVADMVAVQRFTGMRPAEVCSLRPMDVDRSDAVWTYRPRSHKTEHHGRERVVFIGPQAQGVLLKYLARDSASYCFRPCDSEAKRKAERHASRKTSIHCGNRPGSNCKAQPRRTPGYRYDTNSYRRAIHRACDKAFRHPILGQSARSELTAVQKDELRKWQTEHRWSPNRLRHLAATKIRKHFGLEASQVVLGHASANITQTYAERDMHKGIEVARKIG